MTYPLATLAPTIDATGISAPTYNDILQSLVASFRGIYGSDAYLGADSQDYQMLAIFAAAINDSNQAAVAVFQSFSPSYAQGAGLSSLVKINGLARNVSSYSTAVGNVVGQAGTIITNGIVQDSNGVKWALPASVTIPTGGSIAVTVTAQTPGAISALAGTITKIQTPTLGWQSFASTADAATGAAVETDAALRGRQSVSTSLPAQTPIGAIAAAIANLSGVGRSLIYENDTVSTDGNGIPAHSISAVVEGSTSTAIAAAIQGKKSPGTGTYGSTSVTVTDSVGIPNAIHYYPLAYTPIYAAVTIHALPGYVSTTGGALIAAVAAFINALTIGEDVYLSWLYGPAGLAGNPLGSTFKITSLTIGTSGGSLSASDIAIAFNAAASCDPAHIVLTVA